VLPGAGAVLIGALGGGYRRRRYIVFDHGAKAHLFSKSLKVVGPISRCGKAGGVVVSWPQVRDRGRCARCANGK